MPVMTGGMFGPTHDELEHHIDDAQRIGGGQPTRAPGNRVGARDHRKRHAEQRGDEHVDPKNERRRHRLFPAPIYFPRRSLRGEG